MKLSLVGFFCDLNLDLYLREGEHHRIGAAVCE